MLIIGNLLNAQNKQIKKALQAYDTETIQNTAILQEQAGANYLSLCCTTLGDNEQETMEWLLQTTEEATQLPLLLQSNNLQTLEKLLPLAKNPNPIITMPTDPQAMAPTIHLLKTYQAQVIVTCADENGIPPSVEGRVNLGRKQCSELIHQDILPQHILINPGVKPISTGDLAARNIISTITLLQELFPECNLICAPEDISYGLPNRQWLELAFLTQALSAGMKCFLFDPTNQAMQTTLYATNALLGQDPYCGKLVSFLEEQALNQN